MKVEGQAWNFDVGHDTVGHVIHQTLVPSGTAAAELLELELAEPISSPGPRRVEPLGPPPTGFRPAPAPAPGRPPTPPQTAPGQVPPVAPNPHAAPGSAGEHRLQAAFGSEQRAQRFYRDQVLDRLNDMMIEFIGRMDMAFVASADSGGECDASLRAGPAGFIRVLDPYTLAYPEYRGNGVMASLGNISENPHVGILMVDFVQDLIGLHVNGKAKVVQDADLRAEHAGLPTDFDRGRTPERWVVVSVEEAYIHCRKHIPRLMPIARDRPWGTDDTRRKGGDYFAAKGMPRPWSPPQSPPALSGGLPMPGNDSRPVPGSDMPSDGSR
ncbi:MULTISPECIES: pyridoxamine 5'-phosphate oxidase family protein [Actinoalloteichus]|uniref:Pyridoxamine 5'-phosphate oxidase-related, FMN binding n=1 Tax=Actinoalloteichus fjordicus TaxID=1612552 RepID=A0AAC9LHY3_9PSEU|nr:MULTISPECIES: pyridoxamine 5'-phosphate oxidase family protein [Actinoalloteichus]APU17907.1 pyridoxamine 5'-phosphate oxidase-related, FMN binding [Actinoalloteichus fjordicus]APU23985.1 pyridoxamine 5'-phosphate oxidase-related, FMN binding [Actinoalloteichus sp. GBA129-24]